MTASPHSGLGVLVIGAIVVVALVAGGIALLQSGIFEATGSGSGSPTSRQVGETSAPLSISPELAPIVQAARAASVEAQAQAREADSVAATADEIAAQAKAEADKAKAAAATAETAATKACKSPGKDQVCADAADGSHYAGAQACKGKKGCGPEGYGVLTDTAHGWQSAGEWRNWEMVLGCDTANGALTYCGAEAASAWNGFGVSYNANDAAISAEWASGVGKSPMRLDYPTGSHMRGQMTKYELDGRGIYDRADGRVLKGAWQAGQITSGVVTYLKSGTVVSGDFSDGIATLGTIAFADGRVFIGRIEDSPTLSEAMPAEGAIYSPAGAIIRQGTWKSGRVGP